jgi:hypothetical protein
MGNHVGKKKSPDNPNGPTPTAPRKFEINFGFEESAVPLADGTFFSPQSDALDRWVLQEQSHFAGIGPSFQIVYEQLNGQFVSMRYECCECLPKSENRPQLWHSTAAPRGQRISPEQAFVWLSNGQLEIPESLKHVPAELASRQPAPPPAERSLEHWAKSLAEHFEQQIPASTAEYRALAKKLVDGTVILVHQIRNWVDGVSPGTLPQQFPVFIREVRKRYRVNPSTWWGDPLAIAPGEVGMEALPWPGELTACQQHLAQIKGLVVLPLLVLIQARRPKMGNDYYPTPSEFQNAWKTLVDRLPEIELAVVSVRQELLIHPASESSTSNTESERTLTESETSAPESELLVTELESPTATVVPEVAGVIIDEAPSISTFLDTSVLSEKDWKILTVLRDKGFINENIKRWATQGLFAEWLGEEGVATSLKTALSHLRKHGWILSRRGNAGGGGYILTPKGLSALELRETSDDSTNRSD